MAEAVFFRCGINIYCLRINRMDSIKKDTKKQEAYFKILIHTSSVHDESINIRINHLLSERDYKSNALYFQITNLEEQMRKKNKS